MMRPEARDQLSPPHSSAPFSVPCQVLRGPMPGYLVGLSGRSQRQCRSNFPPWQVQPMRGCGIGARRALIYSASSANAMS